MPSDSCSSIPTLKKETKPSSSATRAFIFSQESKSNATMSRSFASVCMVRRASEANFAFTRSMHCTLAVRPVQSGVLTPTLHPGLLGPIGGVDRDVVVRKIAGPDAGGGFALVEVDANCYMLLVEFTAGGGLVEGGVQTSAAQEEIIDQDIDPGRVEAGSGVAGGAEDASPVGIAPRQGGFDERRIGDGARHAVGIGGGLGAADFDRDQFGRALAILGDHAGKSLAELDEPGSQARDALGARAYGDPGGPAGQQIGRAS